VPRTSRAALSKPVRRSSAVGPQVTETKLWSFLKWVQTRLRRFGFYGHIHGIARRFKQFIPKYSNNISLWELLAFQDEEFVRSAYKCVLQREPDPHGLGHYLSLLRTGRLSKIEIMGRLRYSGEGKDKAVQIKGLFIRFAAASFFRVPVIGYIANVIVSFVRLPYLFRTIEQQFSRSAMLHADLLKRVENVVQELEGKAGLAAVEALNNDFRKESNAIHSLLSDYKSLLNEYKSLLNENRLNLQNQHKRLSRLEDASTPMPLQTAHQTRSQQLSEGQEHSLDAFYLSFEDRFRGSRNDIKQRQKIYLPLIQQAIGMTKKELVLDIGCGRGEWLELLYEHGVKSKGVDLNSLMVAQCREFGFDVDEINAIDYLRAQPADSMAAITGFHIIEHLPLGIFIELLDETFRVLTPGGIIILETPNPENILVGSCNFYIDPSHKRPIPPQTSEFIVEARGFIQTEIRRLHPYNIGFQNDVKGLNLEPILQFLTREQDYSIIAYKPKGTVQ